MNPRWPAIASAFMFLGSSLTYAQTADDRRSAVNDPVVGIMGAGINGQMTKLLWDISRVTSEPDHLRVLPILGGGSLQNVEDLLYLRGVDGALVQSDVLAFYRRNDLERDLDNKLEYVAALGKQMAHLLAREDVQSVDDLEGKNVGFGRETSGTSVSASVIFEELGVAVVPQFMSHRKALKALKEGDLDAMFWMTVPPADLIQRVSVDDGFHLLEIPAERIGDEAYQPAELSSDFYDVVGVGDSVETVSVQTVLAVYNWRKDHPRYAKIKKFVNAYRTKFPELAQEPYHPVFRSVDVDEKVMGGWRRFE